MLYRYCFQLTNRTYKDADACLLNSPGPQNLLKSSETTNLRCIVSETINNVLL